MLDSRGEMLQPYGHQQVASQTRSFSYFEAQVDVNHVSSCVLSRVLQMTRSDPESRRLLEAIVREPSQSSVGSLLDGARLDWIRYWDTDAQSSVLLSRLHDSSQCDFIL